VFSIVILDDLLYSPEHIWVRVDEDRAYIGITDFAQHYMNVIVYIELPELDAEVETGSQIGQIEHIKGVSALFSPVGGTIVEVNEEVQVNTQLLQEDPFSNHIAVILMNNKEDLNNLLTPDGYKILCDETEPN
jgi:glycine cleavage system H protein